MTEQTKTPVEELREMIPQLEEAGAYPADVMAVEDICGIADRTTGKYSWHHDYTLKDHVGVAHQYLGRIVNSSKYNTIPEAQKLMRQALSLMEKIE